MKIKYVSDTFLDKFKTNFEMDYLKFYQAEDTAAINTLFAQPGNVIESKIDYEFSPLILSGEENTEVASNNIKILWKSLSKLTPTEAENEKLWVALENTDYLEYHLNQLAQVKGKNRDQSIQSRTIFSNGRKRSLFINNLSLLWWVAYYLIDEKDKTNPFHLIDYFVKDTYRGNTIAFFSSSLVSNKNIALGVVEAIKELTEEGKMEENRYSYSNSTKILNQIGGVRILDLLTRDEIKEIIKANLLDTANIKRIVHKN